MINILISDQFENEIDPTSIEQAILTALSMEQASDSDLSVSIENDQQLFELNSEYRGIEAPTDVLSFEAGEPDPDTGRIYLGDIVISFERAAVQAKAAQHPVQNEVILLAIHGTLHLLGYDHADAEQKNKMWDRQKEILDQAGVVINQLPEE
jgi:probable rRNA maturation factor